MKPELSQQIQRFADGELSAEAQDDLFLELDVSADDGWRSLALAMIERAEIRSSLEMHRPARRPSILQFIAPTAIAAALALFLGIGIGLTSRSGGESVPQLISETTSTPTAESIPVTLGHDVTVRSTLVQATDANGNVRLLPFRELEIRPAL